MRFSTVDEDVAHTGLPVEAATARMVQESVAIHAALGPIAVETRLKELDREIAAQKAGGDPHVALLLGAFAHGGSTSRRRFLSWTAGAGLLAWLVAPRRPDKFRPLRSRELYTTHEIQQECVALLKLKHEWS